VTDDSRDSLTRGASLMVAGVFTAKLLGILFVVPLQNLIGNYALGLYQLVYPLYSIMLTLSTAGFPIALSKTISDLTTRRKLREANATFSIVGRSMLLFGLIAAVAMWIVGPYFLRAAHVGGTEAADALPAIHTLAPALLLLPFISVQRGFLQGAGRFGPSGLSQVVEQIARVGVVLTGLVIALQLASGPQTTAAIATFGATVGAGAAVLLLLPAVRKMRDEMRRKSRYAPTPRLHAATVLRRLFAFALPVALGTLVVPASQVIDAWTVPRLLEQAGTAPHQAVALFGVYSGEALRLVAVPLSFATAIGASVMPAITSALAHDSRRAAAHQVQQGLRLMTFILLPAAVSLVALATPLDIALFKTDAGASIIALCAVIAVFSGLELISTFSLQGYGHFYRPVTHMFIGLGVKLALNLALIPALGIYGAALASIGGYMLSSWLNMISLRHVSASSVGFVRTALRPLFSAAVAGVWMIALEAVYSGLAASLGGTGQRLFAVAIVLVGIGLGAPIYIMVSLYTKATSATELAQIPVAGRVLSRLLAP
jgi:O-antigen/teichoic acid export membrane protein